MAKLCQACKGPVCPVCGGCIHEGECSCAEDFATYENTRLDDALAALNRISELGTEWSANQMGGVSIQRKRWQALVQIARDALAKDVM